MSALIRNKREELEKGIIGLNIEVRKLQDEFGAKLDPWVKDLKFLNEKFNLYKAQVQEEFQNHKEELHRRFTEYKAHINEILLEYKESILIIQSYVDTQLIVTRRDRIDMNIIIESLLKKTRFHDEVSKNFHNAMHNINDIINALVEVLNINYHLQTQDERDRESIALMGLTQNTHTIDYKRNSEVPPISLDKNCLSCSGRVTVILKAFKAACLSYSLSNVEYKGHSLTRLNLLDCVKVAISNLKSKLSDKEILRSELPPIRTPNDNSEIAKLVDLTKKSTDVPWPKIDGQLPIQNPRSLSPRTQTDRTNTDTAFPITRRTKDTYTKVINTELKQRRGIQLPNLVKMKSNTGKEVIDI